MAKQLKPRCKLSRKAGTDLEHKSAIRSMETKCKLDTPPGQHGKAKGKVSDYGLQLQMKQLIRDYYNMLEKQFRRFYKIAERKKGSTGANLLRLLEARMDNIVYRMGLASTRAEARQMVVHKSFTINGTVVDVPSYHVKPGDEIEVRSKAKSQNRVKQAIEIAQNRPTSTEWVDVDYSDMKGKVVRYPEMDELPSEFKINMVVELYSK